MKYAFLGGDRKAFLLRPSYEFGSVGFGYEGVLLNPNINRLHSAADADIGVLVRLQHGFTSFIYTPGNKK